MINFYAYGKYDSLRIKAIMKLSNVQSYISRNEMLYCV